MPNQLPSGRWRARVWHPRQRKQVPVRQVIGGPDTYESEEEAKLAEAEARTLLADSARAGVTVEEWWTEWTTNALWQREAESTNIHYRIRTKAFVERYGGLALRAVGDDQVAEWLRGKHASSVKELRIMWNDAGSAAAGRLVKSNPFANLGLPSSRGRADIQPPSEAQIETFIALAEELTPPSFAAYLDVAVGEGMRPGELDALRWTKCDFENEEILVDEQWNATTRKFTRPKAHHVRTIAMTERARDRLLSLPRESEFCFTTMRGSHYVPSTRAHHWNRVRCAAGLGSKELYLVTRHYFGWYAFNVLELPDWVIAKHLGHRDGGKLVRTLYGHPDERIARQRVREAHRNAPPARPRRVQLRVVS